MNPTTEDGRRATPEPGRKDVPSPPRALLVAAFLLGLASTSEFLRDQTKLVLLCSEQFDVVTILRAAREATPAAVWGWWHGPWIQVEMPYYRPVTSMLYLAEWSLFGHRYVLYSLVSWLLHALNTTLLCALVFRLIPGSPRRRTALAALAAGFFTIPYWGNLAVPSQVMFWWPAQGDLLSLGFGLAALQAWDGALVRHPSPGPLPEAMRSAKSGKPPQPPNNGGSLEAPGRGSPHYWGAGGAGPRAPSVFADSTDSGRKEQNGSIGSFVLPTFLLVFAILSKEMGYVIPPITWLLILHRSELDPRSAVRDTRLRFLFGTTALITLSLWLLRRWFVPEALGFKWKGVYSLEKIYYFLGGPMAQMVLVHDWSLPVATLGGALLLWAFGRRGHWPVGGLAAMVWVGLSFQFLGTSWTRMFLDHNPWLLARGLAYWFAVGLLWRWRREEPVLFAVGALALIHLPLLHHGGAHYLYWPAAGWAITNAVAVACLSRACLRSRQPVDRPV